MAEGNDMNRKVPLTLENADAYLPADVYETADGAAYEIEIPLPGIKPEEIVIEVAVGSVIVSTEPKDDNPVRKYLQLEQAVRSTPRVFEFPMELDTENMRATVDHGMLRIRAPKAVAARGKVMHPD